MAEEQAAEREKNASRWRRWRARLIPEEPPSTEKDAVRVAIKMPEASGHGRIVRRFAPDTSMEELFAFVECQGELGGRRGGGPEGGVEMEEDAAKPEGYEHEYGFRVASLMPRVVYEPDSAVTLRDKLGRSGNLVVEERDVDGSDDDS